MTGGTGAARGCPPEERTMGRAEHGSGAGTAIQGWPLVSRLEFGPLPGAVPCARLHTRNVLHEWHLRHLADDAETLVSELMTNALRASQRVRDIRPIGLCLRANHQYLVIEVWDGSPDDPRAAGLDYDAENGRGLAVIEALSGRWGCQRTGVSTKVVWCELAI
jgi:anti-sigma regulatory factor (Ser/Thr protein kinase)